MPQIVLPDGRKRVLRLSAATLGAGVVVVGLTMLTIALGAQAKYNSVMKQAAQLDQGKDFASEESVLSKYVDGNPPSNLRLPALMKLGTVSLGRRDYSVAFVAYERARSLMGQPDKQIELGIAQSASELRLNATAIEAYRELLKLTPAKNYQQIGDYTDAIQTLENK